MNRVIKAWRVLRGVPTYNDDAKFMEVKATMETTLQQLHEAMEGVREFMPILHTHQEFLKMNIQMKRLARFLYLNYLEEIREGKHRQFATIVDAALHYMTLELESRGKGVFLAPTEAEVLRAENATILSDPQSGGGNVR